MICFVTLRMCVLINYANSTILFTVTLVSAKILVPSPKNAVEQQIQEKTRRKFSARSTSSSSDEKSSKSGTNSEDLGVSDSENTETGSRVETNKHMPVSSAERKGWRKWHRKCTPCPQDMKLKWRDPRIKWICGAYQRARRSFKSSCMMYYRNCQDGTMFVKIHDHRCEDDLPGANSTKHGDHMFYDYKVVLSGDQTDYKDSKSSSLESSDE